MDTRTIQDDISAIGFEADKAAELEYRIQGFTVSDSGEDDAGNLRMTQAGLEDLAGELEDVIGSLEIARDELRAIAGRCEDAADALDDDED